MRAPQVYAVRMHEPSDCEHSRIVMICATMAQAQEAMESYRAQVAQEEAAVWECEPDDRPMTWFEIECITLGRDMR